ncbi:MAG: ATP-binding protein [Polyangiales bacterium]
MGKVTQRWLDIDLPPGRSAFLWGPRKVGKSYWIREHFRRPDDRYIDLLQTDVYAEYATRPALLRERWQGQRTIIDEIQTIPVLLNEVHWLIENKGASFLLTGSSARKLRRGHANLLGGRAWRFEMGPLSVREVAGFDLERALRSGMLPPHFTSPAPEMDLRAYVADYLKEEVAAEARTQNIPAFAEFLRVCALTCAELLNYSNVARECGVSAKVVRTYFQILEDTFLGFRLQPWTRAASRRMAQTEKFYLFDVGVANHLARRRPVPGSAAFGKSFEHFILLEVLHQRRYAQPDLEVRFWRTTSGHEVDLILDDMRVAIEIKASSRIHRGDLRGLRALHRDHQPQHTILVCCEREPRVLEGVTLLPWLTFLEKLWAGEFDT